jgi:hypothetical protein
VRVPPSPPPIFDSEKVFQNQAFLEPPENDGGAPRWSTVVTQIAIIETPVKGESASKPSPFEPQLIRVARVDEIENPQNLDIWLDLNGRRVQEGSTRTMVIGCAEIVSYVSQFMTLMLGDIVATGTPPGVGMGIKPNPIYLKAGDVMTLGMQGLGTQCQEVENWSPSKGMAR